MKKFSVLFLMGVFSLSMASASFAEDKTTASEGAGNSLTGFLRNLFHYPVKATQETGSMTANTLNNTGEKVLSKTGENLSQGKVGEAVIQSVVGTAETTGQTVKETVEIPVKAAEEDKN